MKRFFTRKWGRILIVALAASGLGYGWQATGGLEPLERVLYDALVKQVLHREQKSKTVTIIKIDDQTFETVTRTDDLRRRYGRWPYDRIVWADLAQYLAGQGGARAMVMDVVMDEHNNEAPEADAEFAERISEIGLPLYVGFSVRPLEASEDQREAGAPIRGVGRAIPRNRFGVGRHQSVAITQDDFGVDAATRQTPDAVAEAITFPVTTEHLTLPVIIDDDRPAFPNVPIPEILDTLPGFGLVFPEEDADGVMRRTHFAYRDAFFGNTYAMLSVGVAADLLHAERLELSPGRLRLGSRSLSINQDGTAELDFGGTLFERFDQVSLAEVMEDWRRLKVGKEPRYPDLFRDRVVLVGATALGTFDQKATPFESRAPGVIKQAVELETLLGGQFIVRVRQVFVPFWALLLALASAAVVTGSRRAWLQLAWLPAGIATASVTCAGLLSLRLHLPIAMSWVVVVFASVGAIGANYLSADRERQRMQTMFSQYVSKLVVDELAQQEELPRLDGENREITAFFSDIRSFSTFSERFKDDPKALVRLLNTYLTRVTEVLQNHGACLDKYIGDAVVCIFGAPAAHADHAVRACRAALEAQQEIARLRAEYKAAGLPDLYTRIGVNSAVMFVGNFGSQQRFAYTAMGDGMNLASRLEGVNKAYHTLILIGPRTYELARDQIEAREVDWARVAGKTEAVALYELMALKGQLPENKRAVVDRYRQGLEQYRAARFAEAVRTFDEALRLDPEDGPSQVLRARCAALIAIPPKMPFDAVVDLEK